MGFEILVFHEKLYENRFKFQAFEPPSRVEVYKVMDMITSSFPDTGETFPDHFIQDLEAIKSSESCKGVKVPRKVISLDRRYNG
jgi:hypothetical protein